MTSGIYRTGLSIVTTVDDLWCDLVNDGYTFSDTDNEASIDTYIYNADELDTYYSNQPLYAYMYPYDTTPYIEYGSPEFQTDRVVSIGGLLVYAYEGPFDGAGRVLIAYYEFTSPTNTSASESFYVDVPSPSLEFTFGVS